MNHHKCKKCGKRRSKGQLSSTRCTTCRNARSRGRRQRKERGQGTYTRAEVWIVYMHQRCACAYCGVHIPLHGPQSHIDHLVPLAEGGLNSVCNLVLACASCDEAKGNKNPWLIVMPWS
jgi:5-methylcytosine-specific restriction endonuclease McrA